MKVNNNQAGQGLIEYALIFLLMALIILVALAGLGLAGVNALRDCPWGTFTIGLTVPIALLMGFCPCHATNPPYCPMLSLARATEFHQSQTCFSARIGIPCVLPSS